MVGHNIYCLWQKGHADEFFSCSYAAENEIVEWIVLKVTLKTIQFQVWDMETDATHCQVAQVPIQPDLEHIQW